MCSDIILIIIVTNRRKMHYSILVLNWILTIFAPLFVNGGWVRNFQD